MGDEKFKQELFYMVRLTSKYDFTKMEVVEGILRLESERRILDSVFGCRFKSRIFDIAAGANTDKSCVLCGQPADNGVICTHCMETIGGSEYARSRTPNEQREKKFKLPKITIPKLNKTQKTEKAVAEEKNKVPVKLILQGVLTAVLVIVLCFQLWILSLWRNIPTINPLEEPKVSEQEPVAVASEEEAAKQLAIDFPESQGYTITFARMDKDYVGRFLIDKGACCEEVEEQLTDEERYDYFFTEEVYVYHISLNEPTMVKLGVAEVNSSGSILVMGSFNDGRKTDSHYKYR